MRQYVWDEYRVWFRLFQPHDTNQYRAHSLGEKYIDETRKDGVALQQHSDVANLLPFQ